MPTINRNQKNNKRKNNINKDLAHKTIYNTRKWNDLRKYKLFNNPLCEECLKNDITTLACEVHHITPFLTGSNIEQIKYLGFDYNNLMSLCTECHQKKHIRSNK